MARITVEDCLKKINNRFELVMVATKRARDLVKTSAEPILEWENDKPTVMALREIAAGHVEKHYVSKLEIPESTLTLATLASSSMLPKQQPVPIIVESDVDDLADEPELLEEPLPPESGVEPSDDPL